MKYTAENDLFSYKLGFETGTPAADGFYDGNIGKQSWLNRKDSQNRSFTYNYDAASRFKSATYTGLGSENFSLPNMSFDKNGNITNLQRFGRITPSGGMGAIDNLTYTYEGNRLLGITDAITANDDVGDFRQGPSGGSGAYSYWANGNLKSDANKGISLIEYNTFLKRVKKVTWSNGNVLNFYYDGSGTLLKKVSTNDTWIYNNELIYKNSGIYQIASPEGRMTPKTSGGYAYEFDYRDHQGNLRLSFRDSLAAPVNGVYAPPVITQITEQDPWGLEIKPLSYVNSVNSNNFKFQNQEKINDYGLNLNWFKYRPFDPQTGRGWQIDRLSEKYTQWGGYVFSGNVIVNAVEIDGLEPYIITGRSFIPYESIPNPIPFANTKSFAGDNRNSYQVNTTEYRTEQKVKVDFDNKKVTVLSNKASSSIGYGENNKVTETSSTDKAGPTPKYTPATMEDKSTTINMQINASNKLVSGAPSINYDVNIKLTQEGENNFNYQISGKTDGFPAYEFFITNEATGKSYFIYGSNPKSSSDTPTALFPPMEKNVNSSGNSSKLKPIKEVKF